MKPSFHPKTSSYANGRPNKDGEEDIYVSAVSAGFATRPRSRNVAQTSRSVASYAAPAGVAGVAGGRS
jgi:hypothetical protein